MNKQKILIHCLFWIILAILLVFPFIEAGNEISDAFRFGIIPVIEYLILFYLNYLLLVDKYLSRNKKFGFILINICVVVLLFVGVEFLQHLSPPQFNNDHPKPPKSDFRKGLFFMIKFKDLLIMCLPIILATVLRSFERISAIEKEKSVLQTENLEAELAGLKQQINPHFLFNSLNNIYSLITSDPEKAKDSVHGLSKLMRYILHESSEMEVSLKQEVDFIEKYIRLMELRVADHVEISYDFDEVKHEMIAPLLLLPIVENSFKHGISGNKDSSISFALQIFEDEISFTSVNTYFPKGKNDNSGSGIGLSNLQKRLNLLYKNAHSFSSIVIDDHVVTELKLFPKDA